MTQTLFTIPTIESIKRLGLEKSDSNFAILLDMFMQEELSIDIKREIVSSIGRQKNNDKIYEFLKQESFKKHYMEVIYQMFRTCLYKSKEDTRFADLRDKILRHYNNEVMQKMLEYYLFRQQKKTILKHTRQIIKPSLLMGDNRTTLNKIQEQQIQLIFTSPPYYNARLYSDYKSYQDYLDSMLETLKQCYRILEDGRFILINVSPVITKRVVLLLVALMLLIKTLIMFAFLSLLRKAKVAMRIALSLSQIGEFSFAIFLLASQHKILNLGLDGGILNGIFGSEFVASITPNEIYQFLTLMVIFSMIATPFILDRLDLCVKFALKIFRIPLKIAKIGSKVGLNQKSQTEHSYEVVICGYGALGKKVLEFFNGCDVTTLVVDSNYERVEEGIKKGCNIVYGNITDKMIFREIGIQKTKVVILCVESPLAIEKACRHIMDISHLVRVIAQTDEETIEADLRGIGLYAVINGSREVAEILANSALEAIKESKEMGINREEESR